MRNAAPFLFAAATLLLACEREAPPPPPKAVETPAPAAPKKDDHAGHHHHHVAPHGGTLAPIGKEFANIEFVFEPKAGRMTAYVLDGCAENAIRIAQPKIELDVLVGSEKVPFVLDAVFNTITGEHPGDSSQFMGTSEKLAGKKKFEITVRSISIKGQSAENVVVPFPEGNEHDHDH